MSRNYEDKDKSGQIMPRLCPQGKTHAHKTRCLSKGVSWPGDFDGYFMAL